MLLRAIQLTLILLHENKFSLHSSAAQITSGSVADKEQWIQIAGYAW